MSFSHPILHKQINNHVLLQVSPGVSHFPSLCFCYSIIFWGIFFCTLPLYIWFFHGMFVCISYCKQCFIHFKKTPKPPFSPGHTFDVLLNIVISLLRYCGFCQLNDIFFYLVTLTSHLFYYRLHREAITVLSCQSSRTICMTLLVYDLILGGPVRNRELDFMILLCPFQLEIFYDSVFYLTEVSYVRQWEGLVWTSTMPLRNGTFKLFTSILKGNLSSQKSIFLKWGTPSYWGLINYWGSMPFFF